VSTYRLKLSNLYAYRYYTPSAPSPLYPGNQYPGTSYVIDSIEIRENLGQQTNTGGTAQLDYLKTFGENKRLSAYISLSAVDGKVEELNASGALEKVQIGNVAPRIVRIGGELAWNRWTFSPRLTCVSQQRVENLDPANTSRRLTLDGYRTLDLGLRSQLQKRIEAFANASNALNAKYRNVNVHAFSPSNDTEWAGTPQDPQRIALGAQVRF
jgi:outer membrane receptor protein involved in Fe transport